MDNNIQERMTESSKACLESFKDWETNKKDTEKRETLLAAVHELRKVSSRIEIEVALSERDEQARKNIPIPAHRSHKNNKSKDASAEDDSNEGNDDDGDDDALPSFIKGGESGNTLSVGGGSRKSSPRRSGPTRRPSRNNDGE